MPKFTVYFKDRVINSKIFDSGVVHIGRDDTNDLVIDNLAVAPAHAAVIIKPDQCIIKQLNDDFPLIINNEKSKEALLAHNDKITLGKHTIIFSLTESIQEPVIAADTSRRDVDLLNNQLEEKIKLPDANIQVMSGEHIGRVLPLKKPMTRFGHQGSGIVVISRRKDGYFISVLEGKGQISVNHIPLDDKSVHLNNNDVIIVNDISLQFFYDN